MYAGKTAKNHWLTQPLFRQFSAGYAA